jgi:hypothetical protein
MRPRQQRPISAASVAYRRSTVFCTFALQEYSTLLSFAGCAKLPQDLAPGKKYLIRFPPAEFASPAAPAFVQIDFIISHASIKLAQKSNNLLPSARTP